LTSGSKPGIGVTLMAIEVSLLSVEVVSPHYGLMAMSPTRCHVTADPCDVEGHWWSVTGVRRHERCGAYGRIAPGDRRLGRRSIDGKFKWLVALCREVVDGHSVDSLGREVGADPGGNM
jgi:hypothetical protein